MGKTTRLVVLMCASSLAALAQVGQNLPHIEGTTLNNQKIALPDATRYRAIVLVLGFTHKSAEQADGWGKRLAKEYSSKPDIGYFEVPVLQSAPGMVRPMIVHGMRKGTPADEQAHVLPISQHEEELKKISGYKEPDDAYVVVANAEGRIIWQTHGAATDAGYDDLSRALKPVAASVR